MNQRRCLPEDTYNPEIVDVVVVATLRVALNGGRPRLTQRLRDEIKRIAAERDTSPTDIDRALRCADDFIRESLRKRNGG